MKTRRKAINCKMLEPSKTSPGYFKYQITIQEKDGTEHVVPAYGKDMQDAIERLLWNERVDKVTNKKATMPLFALGLLSIFAVSGMIGVMQNEPIWIVGGLGVCGIVLSVTSAFENYLNK
jgi:hypothetical protein